MTTRRNTFRIIGGNWRGRRLRFLDTPGLRPTPDRVRETVFNWLMPVIAGSRCLDLFAGSGALGLEALSRGARSVTFVDNNPEVMAQLARNLTLLKTPGAFLVQRDVGSYLGQPAEPMDVVFVDAPYGRHLLGDTFDLLQSNGWLTDNAWIYFEHGRDEDVPPLPRKWQLMKSKTAGQVMFHLAHQV